MKYKAPHAATLNLFTLPRARRASAAEFYAPDQPRDDHGRFTNGDSVDDLDVYSGRERFNVATMSAFPKETQDKIVAKLDNVLNVSLAEGKANIEGLLDRARGTDVWDKGMTWYQGAHDQAFTIADAADHISREQVVGAYAAMSPGTVWTDETPIITALVEYTDRDAALNLSPGALEDLQRQVATDFYSKGQGVLAEDTQDEFGKWMIHNGDKFSDLDPRTATFAMRAQYKDDGGAGWGVGFGYDGFTKAVEILRGGNPDELLNGPKVRSFYNNIGRPTDNDDVTIDVHMVQGYANDSEKRNDSTLMGSPAYHTVQIGPTPAVADAIRESAAERGIVANQAQAIAWLQWRAEHTLSDYRRARYE